MSAEEEQRLNDRFFVRPPIKRPGDRARMAIDGAVARILDRNPPLPPRRKRNARGWSTFHRPWGQVPSLDGVLEFVGVVYAWNEADVMWATVSNLYAQGVDTVFVIDDGSTDATASEARRAGATVVERRGSSSSFSEEERTLWLQRFVEQQSAWRPANTWWIIVDADEFPRGPKGTTVRSFVETLPSWVDVVGSRVLDHSPCPGDSFDPYDHPAKSLTLARWYFDPYCSRQRPKSRTHWKHQLFRVRSPGDIYPAGGRHLVGTKDGQRAREAHESLLVHHVPLRDRSTTEERLRRQADPGGRYESSPTKYTRGRPSYRLKRLADLYEGRALETPNEFASQRRVGLRLRPWWQLVAASERTLPPLMPRTNGVES